MPKRNPNASKVVTFDYDKNQFDIRINRGDHAASIDNKIRTALSIDADAILTYHLMSAAGPRITANYNELKRGRLIFVKRDYDTHAAANKINLINEIVRMWKLPSPDQIFPASLAPRYEPSSVQKATAADGAWIKPPSLWANRLVKATWKLAKITIGSHDAAVQLLAVEANERQSGRIESQFSTVTEVTHTDISRAIEKRTKLLAEEGYGNAVFAGGLGEALEGVEGEIEREKEAKEVSGAVLQLSL
ncbi:hypothetical protein P280DRAFT_507209 [Massarina eburnea CBS 473.64]|uniref:Uncharacterized protein n=1 Tax=Massarina eburnea CBS 473.64 TaxID=1395130 RepID=A0A6A6RZJ9_9PLEO|nr:hypothetical protein P280DRAFT_507209 [Massarina eburnea CBS 473.64]